ncbi:hypothetical protein V2J09_011925 [Rumex salicifolius]
MASSVVVKVKYENKLRRFNAAVNENQQLELDLEGLRAKIRSLFDFTPDSILELTYEDEDADIVALVDEEDLHDVLQQGLNPVRITVQLNTGSAASVKSTGTSTPVPAQDQPVNSPINSSVAELLKKVPEPFREHLQMLSSELATPMLVGFIENLTKSGNSFLKPQTRPQTPPVNVASNKEASESQNKQGKDASGNGREVYMSVNDKSKRRSLSNTDLFYGDRVAAPDEGTSSGKATTGSAASKAEKNPIVCTKEVKRTSSVCPFSDLSLPQFTVLSNVKSVGPTEGSIFHRGVRCDGCGALPITGPRFKSKVKEDYDLCRICFQQMGKDSDYIRIDFPAPYRHPFSSKVNPMMNSRRWTHSPPPFCGRHMKQFRPKLDSRFILDVTVMDGTMMAPKSPFTKIWRMRNNGNLPWTLRTQLVWIGGDKFGPTNSVEIEVPVAGLYPENEVDVAVDFIAPELPGRYISYWKMASPSGQKFGQRVWVLIQVDASLSEVSSTVPNSLNLNLPPEGTGENHPEQPLDAPIEPLVNMEYDSFPVLPTTNMPLYPMLDKPENELSLPDCLTYVPRAALSSSSSSAPPVPVTFPTTPAPSSSAFELDPAIFTRTYIPRPRTQIPETPQQDDSIPTMLVPRARRPNIEVDLYDDSQLPEYITYPGVETSGTAEQADSSSGVEEALLKELEQMGFKQVEMNQRILRKNDYDFEKSLDELCNVSEWDLLLEELLGMGFVDGEVNKRVLAKNNGSLKHAVMDLITRGLGDAVLPRLCCKIFYGSQFFAIPHINS